MNWNTSTLPKTDENVLVCLSDNTVIMGVWKNDTITRGHHWEIYWQEGLNHIAPSHRNVLAWMPLPEPPEIW